VIVENELKWNVYRLNLNRFYDVEWIWLLIEYNFDYQLEYFEFWFNEYLIKIAILFISIYKTISIKILSLLFYSFKYLH